MSYSEHDISDETLGRWLAGELSQEEQAAFEKTEAFATYKAIADYSAQLEAPTYDTVSEFKKLKAELAQKETPVVSINRKKFIGIAASIAAIFVLGFFLFWNNDPMTTITTAQGETKHIELPDQSEVDMNIASTLEYDAKNWENERNVRLEGEAYFKVTKGNQFTINTEHGTIEVLGTEFNVRSRNSLTEVICYEGKVKVTDLHGGSVILEVGDVARINNGHLEEGWAPSVSESAEWKNGSSYFHDSPFEDVLQELENQYSLKVIRSQDYGQRNYTGAFPHDNLSEALPLIFDPLGLTFSIENDTTIIAH